MQKIIFFSLSLCTLSTLAIKDITITQKQAQLAFNAWQKCKKNEGNDCQQLKLELLQFQKTLHSSRKNNKKTSIERHADIVTSLFTN